MKDTNFFQEVKSNREISNKQSKKSLKIRNIASQVIATIACNFVKFSHGNLTAFTSLLLAELSQENSEIKITKGELTWFASYFFMSPVGAILFGLLSHRIGSRVMLLVTSITYSIAGIMFYFATNSPMILVAQALVGLMIPATISCGTTYITEITQPHLRSPLITSGSLFISFGALFTMLMRQFFKWKIIAIIITIFPVIGFLGMLFLPDSPYWLARKERFDEAEVSLTWLRGWTSSVNVRDEFLTLKEANIKEENEDYIKKQKRSLRVFIKPFMEKSLWIPMCIAFYVLIMFNLTGAESIKTYNVVIFRMNKTPFDIYLAGTIYDGVRIIGGIICMFSINTLGKRKLLFISVFGAGSAYIVIAIVLLLIKLNIGNLTYLLWIPPVMLIFAAFIFSVGIEKIIYMLNSELLPTRFREIGMGMGRFVSTLLLSLLRKVFLYMVDTMTLQGVFMFFGINCFIALVTFYFIVPETEGKSLIDIENHFAGKQSQTDKAQQP